MPPKFAAPGHGGTTGSRSRSVKGKSLEEERVQMLVRFLVLVSCLVSALQARSETVTFPTADPQAAGGDIVVTGVLTKPPGDGPFPSVVLLHTCGGLTGHVAKDWPEFLTAQGHVALARRCRQGNEAGSPTPLSRGCAPDSGNMPSGTLACPGSGSGCAPPAG